VSTFSGDGFGGPGPAQQKRIPIDAEGLALANDGGFWVSDEYGPYVYHFDTAGKMIGAIRPPDASESYLFLSITFCSHDTWNMFSRLSTSC
jgi:hypothetical protein